MQKQIKIPQKKKINLDKLDETKEFERYTLEVNKKKPFWINGDMTLQHYNEHEYINYSIEVVKKTEEANVAAFRKKYNITEPNIYEGENLGLEF